MLYEQKLLFIYCYVNSNILSSKPKKVFNTNPSKIISHFRRPLILGVNNGSGW